MGLLRVGGGFLIGVAVGAGILILAPHVMKFLTELLAETHEKPISSEKKPRKRAKKTVQ
jgi:hypothetical protein